MLHLFTLLFTLPHLRPPRYRDSPFQMICVWVSTFKFLLCFTTSMTVFQVAPLNLGSNPKQSISLLSTVFFMHSQFSRYFFRLHLLCSMLLPTFSFVKRNMLVMDSADSLFIFKTSLDMVFVTYHHPWKLSPLSFICHCHCHYRTGLLITTSLHLYLL